ncbi:MAG: ATP-binding protein [Cyanobacteria bacterium J06621_8]
MGNKYKYSAEQIKVVSGFEAVRKRPGMYVGATDAKGLHQMLNEVIDNSVEEAIAGFCNKIEVILRPDNVVTVIGNGRGLPVEIDSQTGKSSLEIILTVLSAWSLFKKYGRRINSNSRGTDFAPINFLSEWLEITVWQNNKIYYQRYEQGKPVNLLSEEANNNNHNSGTSITFKADQEIFKKYKFNPTILQLRLQELAYLNANLQLTFKDLRTNSEKITRYHYPQGMRDYLSEMNRNRSLINEQAIHIREQQDNILVEVALQWNADDEEKLCLKDFHGVVMHHRWRSNYSERDQQSKIYDAIHLLSFVNQLYTLNGGTHVAGVKQGIIQAITAILPQYSNRDRQSNLTWETLSFGLTGIISVMLPQPEYGGAAKWELISPDVTDIVSRLVEEACIKYFSENLPVLQKILKSQ